MDFGRCRRGDGAHRVFGVQATLWQLSAEFAFFDFLWVFESHQIENTKHDNAIETGRKLLANAKMEHRVNYFVGILNSERYTNFPSNQCGVVASSMRLKSYKNVPFGLTVPLAKNRISRDSSRKFERAQVGLIIASGDGQFGSFGRLIFDLTEPKGPTPCKIRHRTRCLACSVPRNSPFCPVGRKDASDD
jgi:hypothetical protein